MSKRKKPRKVYKAVGPQAVYCTGINIDEATQVAKEHFRGVVPIRVEDVTSKMDDFVSGEDACNDIERARTAPAPMVFIPRKDKYQINDQGTKADGFTILYPERLRNYI